jgi:hypothetical protein
VFGVSGNHELYADDGGRWLDVWDRLGVHTLRNDHVGAATLYTTAEVTILELSRSS